MRNHVNPESAEATIACIVLAAGHSKRIGVPKLALPIQGKSLLRWTIESALSSMANSVFVVVRPDHRDLQADLRDGRVRVVVNEEVEGDQSSSIRAGVRAAAAFKAVVLLLGDQPFAGASTIDALIREYRSSQALVVACDFGTHQGPPVLFDSSLFPRLLALSGDAGARTLLRENAPVRFARVDSPLAGTDIDTYEDYRRLQQEIEQPDAAPGKAGPTRSLDEAGGC